MTVVQISEIKHRTGRREELAQLAQSEIAVTFDSGELFVGMPSFSKVQYRKPSFNQSGTFPYGNVKILTEFDVVHTLSDKVATHSPLYRWYGDKRTDTQVWFTAKYKGLALEVDDDGKALSRLVTVDFDEDRTGAVILAAEIKVGEETRGIDITALDFTQNLETGKSAVLIDMEAAGLDTITSEDTLRFRIVPAMIVESWPVGEVDSMVIHYSLSSREKIDNRYTKRTGMLQLVADDYSASVVDQGVDLNQRPGVDYLRVVFSASIMSFPVEDDPLSTEKRLVLKCANIGNYPIQITYHGSRWSGVVL